MTVLMVGGVVWFFRPQPDHLLREVDAAAVEELRLREAEDEVMLQAYFELIDHIRRDFERTHVTQDRARELRLAVHYLAGYTQRYAEDRRSNRRMAQIVAHRQLGMALLLLHDYLGGEAAIRQSLETIDAMDKYAPGPNLDALRAGNQCSLSWTLAMTGRWTEAEQAAQASVDTWKQLLEILPDPSESYAELAICRRNLAMIREVATGDGLEDALASVEAATRSLADSGPDENTLCASYETLIDSEQFLGMLYYRHGLQSEAEQACQSSLDRLQDVLMMVETLFETHMFVPRTEHYLQATKRAQRNLDLLSQPVLGDPLDVVEVDTPVVDKSGWDWQLLENSPGQILPIDIVVRGKRLPGEFESQDALLMNWQQEWAREVVSSIISAVHASLPVVLLVESRFQRQSAERALIDAGVSLDRIRFLQTKANAVWVRDFGPLSVESASGTPLWIDPIYTGFTSFERFDDDDLPRIVSQSYQVSTASLPRLIEGGGVLGNGKGICLVSTSLRDLNAQMGVGEAELTQSVRQYLGAEQVVYLDPLKDEPTGHVDWFCAFTSADTIVVGEYGAEDPINRDLLDHHAARLAQLQTPGGKLNVVRIPMPPRAKDYFGGSYTNVIFANGVLIVPTWPEASAETEQHVLEQYQQLLPDWKIVPIPSRRFGIRGGGPHCSSMNLRLPRPLLGNDPST